MDPDSLAVFSTLLINVIGTIFIFFGWLILRKCRGDKKRGVSPRQSLIREKRDSFASDHDEIDK